MKKSRNHKVRLRAAAAVAVDNIDRDIRRKKVDAMKKRRARRRLSLPNKGVIDMDIPFNPIYGEQFEFWLAHGRSWQTLSDEYKEFKSADTWRSRAIRDGWYGEAAIRLRERYEMIKEAVESENVERAKGLIGVAYASLETAFIRDESGNVIETAFEIKSASDFDKVARLILLLQGDADSRHEINDFSSFMQAIGDEAVGIGYVQDVTEESDE